MLCPQCVSDGNTHHVHIKSAVMTTLHWQPEFDPDTGLVHRHDRNIVTTTWGCTGNHEWISKSVAAPCWCGWQATLEETVDYDHDPAYGDGD